MSKLLKYITYCLYGIIILGVLVVAILYFNVQVNSFFEEHGKNIIDTVNSAKTASKEVIDYLSKNGATELIPKG